MVKRFLFVFVLTVLFPWIPPAWADDGDVCADQFNMSLLDHGNNQAYAPWVNPVSPSGSFPNQMPCMRLGDSIVSCQPHYSRVGRERCFVDSVGKKWCVSDFDVSCECRMRTSTIGNCTISPWTTRFVHCGVGHYECNSMAPGLSRVCQRQKRSKFSSSADVMEQVLTNDDTLLDPFDSDDVSE